MDIDEDRVPWKTGIYGYHSSEPNVRRVTKDQRQKEEQFARMGERAETDWLRTAEGPATEVVQVAAEAARMNAPVEDPLTSSVAISDSPLTREIQSRFAAKSRRNPSPARNGGRDAG